MHTSAMRSRHGSTLTLASIIFGSAIILANNKSTNAMPANEPTGLAYRDVFRINGKLLNCGFTPTHRKSISKIKLKKFWRRHADQDHITTLSTLLLLIPGDLGLENTAGEEFVRKRRRTLPFQLMPKPNLGYTRSNSYTGKSIIP